MSPKKPAKKPAPSTKLGRVDLAAAAAIGRAGTALAVLDAVAKQVLAGAGKSAKGTATAKRVKSERRK